MCWAYRLRDAGLDAGKGSLAAPTVGQVVRAGQAAVVLIEERGGLEWMETRYGVMLHRGGRRQLIWNARDDKIETSDTWTRLDRQRFAVPIDAYVENAPTETWFVGPQAWMIGYYDDERDGGCVTITETGIGADRIPVLVDAAAAKAWILADPWDAGDVMRAAARIVYDKADAAAAASLSAQARERSVVPRAA